MLSTPLGFVPVARGKVINTVYKHIICAWLANIYNDQRIMHSWSERVNVDVWMNPVGEADEQIYTTRSHTNELKNTRDSCMWWNMNVCNDHHDTCHDIFNC